MGIQLKWEIMLLPPVDENAAVVLPSTAFAVLLNPPSCRHVDDSWHKACAPYHNMKTLWLWLKLLYFKETDAYLSVKFVFDASATSSVYMRYLYCPILCSAFCSGGYKNSLLKSCLSILQSSGMFSPGLSVEWLSDASVLKYFHLPFECEGS